MNDPEIDRDLLAGKKITAIARYRTLTGAGLADAKHAVEARERQLQQPGAFGGEDGAPNTVASNDAVAAAASNGHVQDDQELLQALIDGRKIAAIARFRELTGANLADAKHMIDAIEERLPTLPADGS